MSSSKTPSHSPSNPRETAEVRVLFPRGLLRSNYTSAHVVMSSRIYWKTANDNATSVPLSLMDFRNASSLELIRLNEGTWDEVDDIVKVDNTEERKRITVPGRLHGRERWNKCLIARDVQVEIIPSTTEQHEAWVDELRARIAPWNLLLEEMKDAASLAALSGLGEREITVGGLATSMIRNEPSSMSPDEVEEQRMDNLNTLPKQLEKLSIVDKLTAQGAAAVGSGAALAKLATSSKCVTETAELLAGLSKGVAGVSAIFQLVSLSAKGVSMCAEASRGRRLLPFALVQITILLRYVLESLAKIMRNPQSLDETAIDFVFNALKETVCVMDLAETQFLRGRGSQIVNAEDVRKVEDKLEELRHMAVTADNTSRICAVDERVNLLEEGREVWSYGPHHVPPSVSAFFSGRSQELMKLKNILLSRGSAVITQYGGVGKTELMIALADRAKRDGEVPGGVFWAIVDGDENDVIGSLAGLAEKLTRRKMSEQDRRNASLVIAWLKQGLAERVGRWLLCLDNADNSKVNAILDEVCAIAGPSQGNGWIVVTSRQGQPQIWGRMKSEQKLILEPLCAEDAMVALWRRSRVIEAGDSDDDEVLREIEKLESDNDIEYRALKELCGDDGAYSLGGLPLALVQAGTYIARFECSFAEYLNQFKSANRNEAWQAIMNKTEELKSIRESQKSIWTTWKISVEKLSGEARAVLRAMAILGQGDIREAIVNGILKAAVGDGGGGVAWMIQSVIVEELMHGSSLISRSRGEGQEKCIYIMHRLVRLFILNDMGRGSAIWKDVYGFALPAVHEEVKTELETEGNSFCKLPDLFESNHRELAVHSLALVDHHVLPVSGSKISDVSKLEDVHLYCGMVKRFMGKSEEEVHVWEHLLAVLQHQQQENHRRRYIKRLLDVCHCRSREKEPTSRIANVYNNLGYALTTAGQLYTASSRLEQSLEMNRAIHGHEPHLDIASSLNNLGLVYRKMGRLDEAQENLEQCLAIERVIHGNETPHPDIAKSLRNLGIVYRKMGKLRKSLESHEQSLEIEQLIHGSDKPHPDIAKSLNNIGNVYRHMGELEKALEKHERSLEIERAIHRHGDPHPDIAKSLDYLGHVQRLMGELDEALKNHEESLEMKRAIYGENKPHPDIAKSLNNLGLVYRQMKEPEQSLEKLEESLKMKRAIHGQGKPNPEVVRSLDYLGNMYRQMGKLDKALPKHEESLKMKRKIHGEDTHHLDILKSLNSLGLVFRQMQKFDEALKKYKEILDTKRAIHGQGGPHPEIAKSLDDIGIVYRQMGNLDKAIEKHEESLDMKREIYGEGMPHSDVAKSLDNIGGLYRQVEKLEKALEKHSESLEMKRAIYGLDEPHSEIAKSLDSLGHVYRQMGELHKALEKHEESLKIKRAIHGQDKQHPAIGKSLNNLENLYNQIGRLDDTPETQELSLEMS